MKIIVYENNCDRFFPLINLFPQFNLRIGMKTIAEHTVRYYKKAEIEYIGRDVFGQKQKAKISGPVLYLSAQLLITERIYLPKVDTKFVVGSETVGFIKHTAPFPKNLTEIKKVVTQISRSEEVAGVVINNMWDLIRNNATMLIHHSKSERYRGNVLRRGIYVIGDRSRLYINADALVHDQVTFDLSNGPVYIDKGAIIRPYTTIVGPSYIGHDAVIDRAKIIESSIGPVCRIGGEVEACIFQGYSNKYHEGFIGHSYIGEWVNLGALTTNSDLKNNYGPVRVRIGKKEVDTGMKKLGCFIGDHTKTGIGTLIPTGSVIGSFVNFFGGGMTPKYVSCFKWLTKERQKVYKLEKAIETVKTVMQRRGLIMSDYYEDLIRKSYKWRNL